MSVRLMLDALEQDVRYALRGIRSRPAFAAAVAITMALGIGVDATMFGVLDRLLFRAPDGITQPDRVFQIETHALDQPWYNSSFSYAEYADFRDHPGGLEAVGVVQRPKDFPLGRGVTGTSVSGALASASFFTALGVHPALGRFFQPDEDDPNAPRNVAVIGYGFWRRHFAGSRAAIGSSLEIGAHDYRVVGVAPNGFNGIGLTDVDVWLPISAPSGFRFDNSDHWLTSHNSNYLSIVARTKPGVAPKLAAEQATAAYRASLRERIAENPTAAKYIHPDSSVALLVSLIPGRVPAGMAVTVDRKSLEVARLIGLMAIVVLIIACANVGNLLLVRAFDRRREIAIRLALGVTRTRLAGQLFVEGVLLSLIGGIGALIMTALASGTVRVWLLGKGASSAGVVDGRMLAFTAIVTIATGVATSLVPVMQSAKADVNGALKSGVREGAARRSRTREALLVVQAALAIVLLAGAGLFVRSVQNVHALPLGIDVPHVVVADFDHRGVGMTNEQAQQLYEQMIARVGAVPGVRAAALSVGLPFALSWSTDIYVPGRTLPHTSQNPLQYAVTDGYFDALGIPTVMGRRFTASDARGAPSVAIINEAMAQLYWPTMNPVGQCARIGADTAPCTTIVGVVKNTRRQDLVEGLTPQIYRPIDQVPRESIDGTVSFFGYKMVVRTTGDAAQFVDAVRRAMQSTSSLVPYPNVRPMEDLLGRQMRAWELGARVFIAFGVLALLLAVVGLYSVSAFSVAQRTREFGVRSALGAQGVDLVRLTLTTSLRPVLTGLVAGVAIAVLAGRFVEAMLFGISARDPAVLGGVCAVLLVAGTAANLAPALRASRVDPAAALRAE
ncbi:MAG TPA: ABC transporter permease [Gemmatimonadaceae bacterium]|nr:ABC transporter permease [Gemmatimonadaceae bacterium]